MALVAGARELVDEGLGDIADHGQAAAHIAVERAIAHRDFALIAGGQHHRAGLVGQGHQRHAAQPRLQILLGDVGRASRKQRS